MTKDSLSLLKDIQQMAEKAKTIEMFREMMKVVVVSLEIIGKADFQKEGCMSHLCCKCGKEMPKDRKGSEQRCPECLKKLGKLLSCFSRAQKNMEG